MMTSREKLGLTLGIAGVLLFGGTLPATKLAVAAFDPLFLSAARAAIAGCIGMLLLLVLRRPVPPRALWHEFLFAGLCTIVGFPVFMALAMAHVPAAHGGVVLGILPLATAAAAALLAHERPSSRFLAREHGGAIVVLVFMVQQSDANTVQLGDLYLLGTVISGAFGYTSVWPPEPETGRLGSHFLASCLVPAAVPMRGSRVSGQPTLADVPRSAWAGLAYVSLISQFFAFFVFNAAMAMGGVARVGQLMLLQPFVIVALSVPVNGERFDASTLLYATAVVIAVLVGQRMGVTRR